MKILILGGSRFIGYLTMCRLVNDGHDVTIFNRQITVPPEPFPKRVRFIAGNRTTRNSLASIFLETTFDVIIDISGYTKKDVEYVLEHCAKKIGHYIFVSSSNVYGPISSRKTREGTLEIDRNNNILSPKYLAERYLLYTAREVNLPITILRPHAVLGQFDPCQAGQIFYRLSKNLPILGLGETSPVTNPVYVYDLVDIICRSIEDNRSIGKIFNVAGDKSVTLDEFVSICSDVSGINGQLSRVSAIADYTKYGTRFNRHGGPVIDWPIGDFVCDNSAVKDTLGIRFTPLTQVLCEIWSSFASSPRTLNTFSFIGESPILKQETISRFTQFRWRALRIGNTIRWSVKKMIKRQPALNRVIRHVRPVLNRSLNRFPKK